MNFRRTIGEAGIFLILSCTVGLGFNEWRARQGQDALSLSRDYFPPVGVSKSPSNGNGKVPTAAPVVSAVPAPAVKPLEHPFQTVSVERAFEYFEQADTSIVFIDARDDEAFRCRIPMAVQFNYYMPERYIQGVLDVAEHAQVVIVYCNGGNCEDSIRAADFLTTDAADFRAPFRMEQVYVFEGGIQAWFKAGHPLEPENCEP